MSATAPQQRRAGRAPYGQQREGEEDEREDLHAPADDHGELASPASSPAPGGSRTASSSNSPTRLAAGTPLSTAPASAAPSRAPPATPVTAQDLLDDPEARCWICYDGKEAVSESGERRMPLVHACSCSLVAHEDVSSYTVLWCSVLTVYHQVLARLDRILPDWQPAHRRRKALRGCAHQFMQRHSRADMP